MQLTVTKAVTVNETTYQFAASKPDFKEMVLVYKGNTFEFSNEDTDMILKYFTGISTYVITDPQLNNLADTDNTTFTKYNLQIGKNKLYYSIHTDRYDLTDPESIAQFFVYCVNSINTFVADYTTVDSYTVAI